MQKWFVLTLLVAFAASAPLYAQSSSATMAIADLNRIDNSSTLTAFDEDPSILSTNIHTSKQKDLVIGVSLECGLTTITQVKSKGGKTDTSTAEGSVLVRVVIDRGMPWERVAYPGQVSFCHRSQTLSAKLQGIIENLACFDDGGVFDPSDPNCDLTAEEIELGLETLNANAFFFGLDNLGTGTHTVHVEAEISTATTAQDGSATAGALIGHGSASVSEVRFVKAEDGAVMN